TRLSTTWLIERGAPEVDGVGFPESSERRPATASLGELRMSTPSARLAIAVLIERATLILTQSSLVGTGYHPGFSDPSLRLNLSPQVYDNLIAPRRIRSSIYGSGKSRKGGMPASFLVQTLVQPEAFCHQALQARLVEQVVGQFLVGEHGQGGAFGSGSQFGGSFDGEARILADHRHHHADHQLQAADFAGFFFAV